jgi:hypothetical protein
MKPVKIKSFWKLQHRSYQLIAIICFFLFNFSYQVSYGQLFFKEYNFDKFKYPAGVLDQDYTQVITARIKKQFPETRSLKIASYITADDTRTAVAHYSRLCGQRFYKIGDRFIYVFSEINHEPATKIEIYPVRVSRLPKEYWPTRIDLCIVKYPLSTNSVEKPNRTFDDLKKIAGRLAYEGKLEEEIALLEIEELGPDAEVYVVSTQNSFEKVYNFFRRRYGRFRVIPARDGDMWARDFEFDATRALRYDRKQNELHIRVDENPLITDREGNSQVYRGFVFIYYIFWRNGESS